MNGLRMAVIGVGSWGRNHVRVLKETPGVELMAVCDVNPQNVKTVAEKYGLTPYSSSAKMLADEDIDAVTICVWSTELAKEALRSLRAGKHVLVEKPMARTTGDARKIIDEADRKGLILSVGFIERFNPGVRRVKESIAEGRIGAPVSANFRRVSIWPQRIGDVGVVKDTAIHDIDMARYIFQEDPIAIFASAGRLNHEKFEDYAQIMLAFPGGKSAFIESNWLTPYKIRKLTITGSEAIITLDYITQETTIETSKQTLTPRNEWDEPLKIELQHFVNCVTKGGSPLASGMDGLKALRIAEAALRSAAEGKLVKLSSPSESR